MEVANTSEKLKPTAQITSQKPIALIFSLFCGVHVKTADRKRTRKRDQLQINLRVYPTDIVRLPNKSTNFFKVCQQDREFLLLFR